MDSAVATFDQSIPVAKELNDTLQVTRITGNIGNLYLHKKDRVKAIEYHLQSAGIWETCADQNRLAAFIPASAGCLPNKRNTAKQLSMVPMQTLYDLKRLAKKKVLTSF